MHLETILLMTGGGGKEGSGYYQFIPLLLIIVVFYFFMIRPQMKKQKEAKKFMENIKKGDKVVTIGGIYGKIAEANDDSFILEIADGVKVKITKAAVSMDGSAALNTPAA